MTEAGEPRDSMYVLVEAEGLHQYEMGRVLFEEYASQLGIDLCFQDFPSELKQLPDMYGPPLGSLVLVMKGSTAVGCGAVRRLSDGVCEMKRLYVRTNERGANLGRHVAERLVEMARALGYEKMLLDTLVEMIPARRLYESLGFREVESYYENPLSNVVYMELDFRGCESSATAR
jgi:putative acetyltransferase